MAYEQRLELYKKIEKIRDNPLLVYITSIRRFAGAQMAQDVVQEFIKHIFLIPKDKTEIDILIVSNGGDPLTACRIISLLRERFKKVNALIPYVAYSAATLLALGADRIIMHPFSNLGPIDPQLTYYKNNKIEDFSSEDLRYFFEYIKSDVGITDQGFLQKCFELFSNEVGPIMIGASKRGSQLTLSMGEKLLSLHMKDKNKAKAIAEKLNKSYYSHGYPVGKAEAKEIGLQIESNDNEDLDKLMWLVWEDLRDEMECDKPFSPVDIVLNNNITSLLLSPIPQAQIPANLPQQFKTQAIQQILSQIQVVEIPPVDYSLFLACVESHFGKSHYKIQGKINAVRNFDLTITVNTLTLSQGWVFDK